MRERVVIRVVMMKRVFGGRKAVASLAVLTAVVLSAASSWALPAVQQVNANPEHIELNRRTSVTITAVIANAAEILAGVPSAPTSIATR